MALVKWIVASSRPPISIVHEKVEQHVMRRLVECKDCKHRFTYECPMHFIDTNWDEDYDGFREYDHTSDDGYCDWGELDETE